MKEEEERSTVGGPLGVNQRRPSNGRPVWKKICSLPDMMIRPDERQDIKTFVNISPHVCPTEPKTVLLPGSTGSFDSNHDKRMAISRTRARSADRTTENLRAILSPSYDTNSKTLVRNMPTDLKEHCPPLTKGESSSKSNMYNGWSPAKQPMKSALKQSRDKKNPAAGLASTWHSPIQASKEPSMFERAATKKKESRWDESTKLPQMHTKAIQKQISPLKTPQRHVSIDSITLTPSIPPLTAYDTDDCTFATGETVSIDLGSLDEVSELCRTSPRDDVKALLRDASSKEEPSNNITPMDEQNSSSSGDVTKSPILEEANRTKSRLTQRAGSDSSPTALSDELQTSLTTKSSENRTVANIRNLTCQKAASAINRGNLLCPDIISKRNCIFSTTRHGTKLTVEPEKPENGSWSRSDRPRSLSPGVNDGKDGRSKSGSVCVDNGKKIRSRSRSLSISCKKKERRSRSKSTSKSRRSSISRSAGRMSTRRRSQSRESAHGRTCSDEEKFKEKNDRSRRSLSKRPQSKMRATSHHRRGMPTTSPTKRHQSKSRSKSRSNSAHPRRSKSLTRSRSKSTRRHRSFSRANESSPSRVRTSSKSSTKRRRRRGLHHTEAPPVTEADQESTPSGKLDELLQSSYGSIEQKYKAFYGRNEAAFARLSSSLSALDHSGATKHSGAKSRQRTNEGEHEMIPISSLLPPKRTYHRASLDNSSGSLHLHDLGGVSTSDKSLTSSGNKSLPIIQSNSSDSDMQKSTFIRTGSTQELVRRWEEEINRTVRKSHPDSSSKATMTTKFQSEMSNGNTIVWVETILGS
ncbi:hypothetical protein IV203_016936 [Nitzschia inconspicua]|uniref:Uncharacterized protein n=1 Tax=Nitzschia inconspicua TaxID=303405 RepID=A0A9K3KRE2_9STRA|nr:hypothetical protein IV203_016936 [Nitzschia inconspicua]